MLEWYCAYEDWRYMMDHTERLVRAAAGSAVVTYQGSVDFGKPFPRLSIPDAIRKQGVDGGPAGQKVARLQLDSLGVEYAKDQGWERCSSCCSRRSPKST